MKFFLLILSVTSALRVKDPNIPVIVFGGMGSKCSHPDYKNLVKHLHEGLSTHVECFETNILGSLKKQADRACQFMKQNPAYNSKTEINVVGQSQGGLIARYIVEECDMHPKVRNLMTIGTPNMGFSEIPEGGC